MASLTLKVKLPKSNQSKTLRFRANMTIAEAARMIAQHEVTTIDSVVSLSLWNFLFLRALVDLASCFRCC
jgi:hypothetical protein